MEVSFPFNVSVGQDMTIDSQSSAEPLNPAHCNLRDFTTGDLETCLTSLKIGDMEMSTGCSQPSSIKSDKVLLVRKDGSADHDKGKTSSSGPQKCFSKCATFPSIGGTKPSLNGTLGKKKDKHRMSEVPEVNPVDQCYSRSMSLPSPQELVSALKGTRVKLGIIPEKLSVTWDPDVYDPIPTSVSHFPSPNKNQRYRKKYKNKQKNNNKSLRGKGKDKEKKQPQKNNANNSNKIKPFEDDHRMSSRSEDQVCIADYDVGNQDPSCGSSFLKNSVAKLHFKATEAS